MARDLVAGIDSSTQSCTIVIRQVSDGAVIATARAPHPPTTPPKSEQCPDCWWTALQAGFSDLSEFVPRIAALSIGSQGHGLVMLDDAGEPLCKAKLWNDTESGREARELLEKLPAKDWSARTGSIPAPAMTVSKIAWMQRNRPELMARIRHLMLPANFLSYRLTGKAFTERGLATGTGYFNPFEDKWEPDLADLAAPGLDWSAILPAIIPSNGVGAEAKALQEIPGLEGCLVAAGSGDNMTAALGMGAQNGDLVISLGTSGTLYAVTSEGVKDPSGAINGYADATGAFMPMITTLNSAKVADAFRRVLRCTHEEFDELALSSRPGADGVVLVPYLDGERTPNLPGATGQLAGLRSNLEPGQIARAVVEGVLCGLLEGERHLSQHGVDTTGGRLIVTGGASQSQAFRQVLADLANRPVWATVSPDAASAGAAVQAMAALSGKNCDEIARQWQPEMSIVAEPDPSAAAMSDDIRNRYREQADLVAATSAD